MKMKRTRVSKVVLLAMSCLATVLADLYLAGTIDQADSRIKPFFLMYRAINAARFCRQR